MLSSLAFVFPGQGSQSVGMLTDLAREYTEIEKTFAEASHVLGYDLWNLVVSGPVEALDKTAQTQPALLAASYAIWKVIQNKRAIKPAILAGHSLGEYSALVCAESLTFTDAIKLVAARGEYMQDAVPVGVGALAAIVGLDDAAVNELCEKSREKSEVLTPVNFNSPGQVVVGGHTNAVQRSLILAKEAGARLAKLLPVSVPSHCELMKPAAERLQTLLNTIEIKNPVIPVINNVDVALYSDAASIRSGLVRQLYMPVRWVELVQMLGKKGITTIVECGPGKVLTGLNKRILAEARLMTSSDLVSLQSVCEL